VWSPFRRSARPPNWAALTRASLTAVLVARREGWAVMSAAASAWSVDRFVTDAHVLDAAARTRAAAGDALGAIACAWGADVSMAKAVAWEYTASETSPSWRTLLTWANVIIGPRALDDIDPSPGTIAAAVEGARRAFVASCEPALQRELAAAWMSVDHLVDLPMPTEDQVATAAADRLAGVSLPAFLAARRTRTKSLLDSAREKRVSGDARGAIQDVYEADLSAVEAYLVESAHAVGDALLLSVITRWELVSHSIAAIPSLPSSVVEAVARLRTAMATSLGPADGMRLREAFAPL